jgi:hypothetical protein
MQVLTDEPPPSHLEPMLRALNGSVVAHDCTGLNVSSALSIGEVLDLTSAGSTAQATGSVEVLVDEGPYLYPIASSTAGWGSVLSPARTARVLLIRKAAGGDWLLLGEAEVRTDPIRPQVNARLFSRAAAVLLGAAALVRQRPAMPMQARELRQPRVGAYARLTQLSRRVSKAVARRATAIWRRHREGQWTIGFVAADAVDPGKAFPWRKVRWAEPPDGGFIADPFLVEDGERRWLFYEHLGFDQGKGTLWVAPFEQGAPQFERGRKALETALHLSFPNVFRAADHWYMLPEQSRAGNTTLYRATEFPFEWQPLRQLLPDFPGTDPVLFPYDGKWWLFVTQGVHPCNENNLHVFWADDLSGHFRPHPMNPVRTGLRGSRMAGPIHNDGGKIIRPGQDCHDGYGEGVILFEIVRLDVERYEEQEWCAWPPSRQQPFGDAFHTYVVCGDLVAIDGRRDED